MDMRNVKLLVLDFDGVVTDNKVYVGSDGRETVCCSRADSLGIELLRERGIRTVVISKEKNPVVAARCRKLAVSCHQGVDDKASTLKRILARCHISARETCYIGNDVNDISCITMVGFGCAVRDAEAVLKRKARYVTARRGGNGAIREVCDLIVKATAKRKGRGDEGA